MINEIIEKKNVISKSDYANVVPASLIHPNESLHTAHIDNLDLDLFANTTFIKDHRGDVGITKMTLNDAIHLYWSNENIHYKDGDNLEKIGADYPVDIYSVAEYYTAEDKPLLDYIDQHLADIVEVHTSLYDYDKYPDSLSAESKEYYRYEIEIMLPNGTIERMGSSWNTPMWSLI